MSNTIVNTNVSALNAHRQILSVGGRQNRSAERLSSGMRINRAADDAAGLAISEGMRNQIRGLDQSVRNSQDGISLVQTAEGALEEVHRMGERIRQLSVQAANDTNDASDRALIELEITQLVEDVNRIISDTEFNGMNLLGGQVGSVGEGIRQTAMITFTEARGNFEIAQQTHELSTIAANQTFDAAISIAEAQRAAEVAIAEAFSGIANGLAAQFQADVNATLNIAHSALINAANNWMAGDYNGMDDLGTLVTFSAMQDELQAIADRWSTTITVPTDLSELETFLDDLQAALEEKLDALEDAATALGDITVGDHSDSRAAWAFDLSSFDFSAVGDAITALEDFADELMDEVESTQSAPDVFTQNAFRALADSFRAIGQDAVQQIFNEITEVAAEERASDINTATSNFGSASNDANGDLQRDLAEANNIFDSAVNTFNSAREAHGITLRGVSELSAQEFGIQSGANSAQRIGIQLNNIQVYADMLEANVMIPVTSGAEISDTLDHLDEFITAISEQRANLGAYQNRLEHTINSLQVTSENLSAANSRIRDTDMAAEMMQFTQANVLQQAGMSMLAQANQAPNNVLQLVG